MTESIKKSERPLSPHLQIYRWPLNMAMSILHRATGCANAVGILLVVWMLVAAATGPDAYQHFTDFSLSTIGKLMIFGWSVSISYHMFNGLRHLVWDFGYAFKIENANRAGYVVLACAALLIAAIWYGVLGG